MKAEGRRPLPKITGASEQIQYQIASQKLLFGITLLG